MRIQEITQGRSVVTIGQEATVAEVVALFTAHNIGAVVVSDDGETMDGIISERDVVRRLADTADPPLLTRTVGTLMTSVVHTCAPADSTADLMATMTEHRIRHVPVVDGGRLVAIVSIGDVVKARIDELAFERDQLDAYVHQT